MARLRRLVPVCLGLALLGGAVWVRAAELGREHGIFRAIPGLDREFLHHLVADSDLAWFSYCRSKGTVALGNALQELGEALRTTDYREFCRRREPLEGALLKVGRGFRIVYGFPGPERRVRHDRALTARADFDQRARERRYIELSSDTRTPPADRIREIDSLVAGYAAAGDPDRALYAAMIAPRFELERGRRDLHRARLESLIDSARAIDEHYTLCQMLGELGVVHWDAGEDDSMRACFDEGIAVALRHGFIDHAARFLMFYANYSTERGHLALAQDRLAEAMRLCDGPGGEGARLRLQIEYTKFLARLECWDLVDRSLRRLPPLLRELPRTGRPADRLKYVFDTDRLQARLEFGTGRAEEGDRLMERLSSAVPPADRRVGMAELFDEWSNGLEKANRDREAFAMCERGLVHCDSAHVPEHAIPLLIRAARLETVLGRLDAARALLDSADARLAGSPRVHSRERLDAEVLHCRLLARGGRKDLAKRQVERTFARYRERLAGAESGSISYLELEEARSLRDAIHEIEGFSPEQGYRFELAWRSLARSMGGARSRPAPRAHELRRLGAGRASLPPHETHLLYRFTGDRLVRWQAEANRVVVDTLPLSAERCLAQVREALELLQSEPVAAGAVLGPRSREKLARLSAILLPAAVASRSEGVQRLDLSPDGPLCALPFEALPLAGQQGEPLALHADVAYVQGEGASRARADGRVVIVTNPKFSSDLVLRYGWPARLPESDAEARAALVRWPNAEILSGERATKDSIRASWPGASILYLAAHHVRDPDAPFLGFVPLAAPASAAPDASLLEIADIHALDLSACRLAVLASCSSGAPYRSGVRPGPSLADAFLDSGASAVMSSFWDVGDAEASEFMRVFLSNWNPVDGDAASLGRARRALMRAPKGAAARIWAAWSVQTTLER